MDTAEIEKMMSVLETRAEDLLAQLDATHHSLSALRKLYEVTVTGERHQRGVQPQPKVPTSQAIIALMGEDLTKQWDAPSLTEELEARGTAPTSGDPVSAIRAAIARLKKSGDIVRSGHGLYVLAEAGAATARELASDDLFGGFPELEAGPVVVPESFGGVAQRAVLQLLSGYASSQAAAAASADLFAEPSEVAK